MKQNNGLWHRKHPPKKTDLAKRQVRTSSHVSFHVAFPIVSSLGCDEFNNHRQPLHQYQTISSLASAVTMPGLTAPSDYSQEPLRHPCLRINAKAILSYSTFPFYLLKKQCFQLCLFGIFVLIFSSSGALQCRATPLSPHFLLYHPCRSLLQEKSWPYSITG